MLVGFDSSDDACVYRISDQLALVQTVDFFPPMVDDPYLFGQIAAANALSDIYAMGGRPTHAMNLLCFPNCLSPAEVRRILEGGYSKVAEAGAVIAGGHSISALEPMYGLCVSGFVDPRRILLNNGVMIGDRLILTKPLGSGIMNTAAKGGLVNKDDMAPVIAAMTQLNKRAAEIGEAFDIHACTDITGFGLLGHAAEMMGESGLGLKIEAAALPVLPKAFDMAEMGLVPGGAYTNRDYVGDKVRFAPEVPLAIQDIICDPQTSGGLLFSVSAGDAESLLAALRREIPEASIIGTVIAEPGIYVC